MIKVIFHSTIEKNLKKLPNNIQKRFFKTVDIVRINPLAGIPLKGEFKDERKYRIGDYRIVYKFYRKEKTVLIYRIESRQGVYKR